MTSLITRCPKCATAFNVTEAHLSTANGSVRCGSCLNVFNGRANLVKNEADVPRNSIIEDDDEMLISDHLELDDDEHEESNPEQEHVERVLAKTAAKDTEEVDPDEAWALALLEEEGHSPSQLGLKGKDKSHENSTVATTASDSSIAETQAVTEPQAISETETASETETILTDDQADESEPANVDTSPEQTPALTSGALKAQEYAETKAKEPEPEPEIAEKDLKELQQELDAAKESSEDGIKTLMDSIEVDAVEMEYTKKGSPWLKRIAWFCLVVIAGIALAAQIAWKKFDQWGTQEPYRTYYAMACEHLGCELPQLKDISQIRTSNLLVRTHPDRDNALLVDVVMQNHASFEQPFPKLTLIFSNIKDKVVASRSFTADEYLGGDMIGASMMPPRKAIHLSLELVDPGRGAVSYKITLEE